MDTLELRMNQTCLNDRRGDNRIVVEEFFQSSHRWHHFIRGRRYIEGVPGATACYPVLTAAKLPRRFLLTSSLSEKDFMHFTNQAQAEREVIVESFESMLQSVDIIGYLAHIIQRNTRDRFVFKEEKF